MNNVTRLENEFKTQDDKLKQLQAEKASEKEEVKEEPKVSKSGKVIYEVSGQQFSAEASFGVIFENLLSNISSSGIRIRSIDYNYGPNEDVIVSSGIGGYNACEISFVTVGNYTQFQHFFKNITKESYLSNIYEVYIEPYDKDKTILIARFKIRLYTRTI